MNKHKNLQVEEQKMKKRISKITINKKIRKK